MYENVVYISQLKPDFDVIELLRELRLDGHADEVITDYAIPNSNAIFLAFIDPRFVEKVILQCNGKTLLGSVVQASRLTEELAKSLHQWKPNFAQKASQGGLGSDSAQPPPNPLDLGAMKCQTKPLTGLSDILEAFDSLTIEQQLQLKATLQIKPVVSPVGLQPKARSPHQASSSLKRGVNTAQQMAFSPKPWQPTQPPETSFQFGNSNISSVRVIKWVNV